MLDDGRPPDDTTAPPAGDRAAGRACPVPPSEIDRLIVRSADVGIVTLDRELRYTAWNPFMEELIGKPGAERIGRTPEEMWGPEHMPFPGYVDSLRRALAGEYVVLHEANPHPQPDGRPRYGRVTAGPLRDDEGTIVGVIITVHDITARKLAEDTLRRRDTILEAVSRVARLLLANHLEDCASDVLSTLGAAVGASRAYVFRFDRRDGWTIDSHLWEWCAEGIAPDPWDAYTIESSPFASTLRRLERGLAVHGPVDEWPEGAQPRLREAAIRSLAVVPIFVDGELWGDCGFDDCLADRRWSPAEVGALEAAASVLGAALSRQRATEALRESEIRRDHLQRIEAIGRLAGGVAHDFNNLLTVITGHLELVRSTLPATSSAMGDIDQIGKAAARAVALSRQLLMFSRREALQPIEVDLNDVVRDVDAMLRRLIAVDVEVALDLCSRPLPVLADPMQLQQVIVNLAVNARDAMPGGGRLTIATEAQAAGDDAGEGRALLRVSDTGTGIAPEIVDTIFEPFFTTKPRGEGVGLGLATAHGIVTDAGGTIAVTSTPGTGTTFTVALPLVPSSRAIAARDDPVGEAVAGGTVGLPAGVEPVAPADPADGPRGERILLVEDELSLRRLAASILEQRGYTVLLAGDGLEGLETVRATDGAIDLIVTDVVMPRMSGRELAARVRAEWPDMPIVFMSGYADEELRTAAMPASAFLQKAFSPEQLAHVVRETIDGGHAVPA